MPTLRQIFLEYLHGKRKTAVFALTNRCNCKCVMCDMHKQPPREIGLGDAKKVLDLLTKNGFLIAYFTGGEPTLHPSIVEIVSYAEKLGLITTMTTNGTSSKALLSELKDAGLYLMSVSIDHWDPHVCERIRNHRGIFEKQVGTLRYLREIGVRTYAQTYLNPVLLEEGVDRLVAFVNDELGVPIGFCYPTSCDVNSYFLGGECSEQSSEGLNDQVKRILEFKMEGRKIANLSAYIEDAISFPCLHPNFTCRGGEDVVYVDWLGDVYPCFLKKKLFNALCDDPRFLKNVRCNNCLINCFREPSLLPQLFSPPSVFLREAYRSFPSRGIYR